MTPEATAQALEALRAHGIEAAKNSKPGELELALRTEDAVRSALRALLDADIAVLGLELEGGRLSDAFLAMTERA